MADLSEPVIVPVNRAPWEDLETIFGARGMGAGCQGQRYKLAPGESFTKQSVKERRHRLQVDTACGDPNAEATSGISRAFATH